MKHPRDMTPEEDQTARRDRAWRSPPSTPSETGTKTGVPDRIGHLVNRRAAAFNACGGEVAEDMADAEFNAAVRNRAWRTD